MKQEKGITLIALTITIIVLLIISSVGIGASIGLKGNINESKDAVATTNLKKVQEAIAETYIKYKNTNNSNLLVGEKISFSEAQTAFEEVNVTPRVESYDLETVAEEICYYKLNNEQLKQLGISTTDEDEYIVNYSTGEAFNNTTKKTVLDNALYVYAN